MNQVCTIFIASPHELSEEREAFRRSVDLFNRTCRFRTNLRFDLLAWEDKSPAAGRPQDQINRDVDRADVFVGCLWRTMGSPSGDGTNTGFEEEFYRALDRHEKTGKPDIALFFKVQDRGLIDDAGPDLQKVLDFRQKHEKLLIFKDFASPNDWKDVSTQLLLDKSLEITASSADANTIQSASQGQSQAEATKRSDGQPSTPVTASSPGVREIARLLTAAGAKLTAANFKIKTIAEPADCTRLMLFSATTYDWNIQHIRLGTHEVNSVYLYRKDLTTTQYEKIFLLRTVLLDPFATSPGWFWIRKRSTRRYLLFLALHDSEPAMRETAVRFAAGMSLPLHRGPKKSRIISQILADPDPSVRSAGLFFLAINGATQDLNYIEPLLTDSATNVRHSAQRAAWKIRVRADADAQVRQSLERGETFDDEMLSIFTDQIRILADETLRIACKNPAGDLRNRAAEELSRRRQIPPELAREFCRETSKKLKEFGYVALIRSGERVDLETIRTELQPDFFNLAREWDKANPDRVTAAFFETQTTEELWRRVEAFDDDSRVAIAVLAGRLSPAAFRSAIRQDLDNRFERVAVRDREARKSRPSANRNWWNREFDPTEHIREKTITAALEALADQPLAEDRPTLLEFLSAELSQTRQALAALRGLGTIAIEGDRQKIVPFLSSSISNLQAAATKAFIQTFPELAGAAAELCERPSEINVWVLVATALHIGDKRIWPALEPLLRSDSEDMRRIVCSFATRVLSPARLRLLLERYQEQHHYYNVVVLLDRALYATTPVKRYFAREDAEYFKKWARIYHPETGVAYLGESLTSAFPVPPDVFR